MTIDMERRFAELILVLLPLFSPCISQAADPIIWYYNHNEDIPGAAYAFSFVHISDIHIGEGDPDGDYGTFGYLDSIRAGELGSPALRLRSSVNWVNDHHVEKNIRFVIVSGDITDSGEKSEFLKAKEILDELEIPYVPLIGNHDIWPYIKGDSAREAPYPFGDSILNETYAGVFDSLSSFFDGWDDGTRLDRGWNAEGNIHTYLQNYVASYQGNHFIFMDFDPRYHAVFPPGPGIGPEAQLHDYIGGTLLWLKETLENLPGKGNKNIFLISHHPPAKDAWAFINAFSLDELVRITDVLLPFRQHLGLWFAGHIHRNEQYILNASGQIPLIQCLEVESNKEQPNGALRVVNVFNAEVNTGIQHTMNEGAISVTPNPSNGNVKILYPAMLMGDAHVSIYAADGRIVYDLPVQLVAAELSLPIDQLAAGTYILKLYHQGTNYSVPLVIN